MQSNQGVRLNGDAHVRNGPPKQNGEAGQRQMKWREVETDVPGNVNGKAAEAVSRQTGITGIGSTAVADFFSPEVFQIVLHNPTTAHQLLKFSQSRFCGENMEFLEKVRFRQKARSTPARWRTLTELHVPGRPL